MIQTISPNDDLVLDVVLTDKTGATIDENLIANLQFVVYTEETSELQRVYLSKSRYVDNKLYINSSELQQLSTGQLYLTTAIALLNSQYNDGSFDYIKTSALPYYLNNAAMSLSDDEAILKWKINVSKALQDITSTLSDLKIRLATIEATSGDVSALMDIIDNALEGYATIEYVDGQDASIVSAIPNAVDLSDYATTEDVSAAIRAIPQPDLTPYATTEDVSIALSGKANTEDLPNLEPYALKTAIPSIEGLATFDYVDQAVADVSVDLTGYATTEDVSVALSTKANTEDIPSLEGYATDASVAEALATKADTSDIPSLEGYATTEDVSAAIEAIPEVDLTPYATIEDVSTALATKANTEDIPSLEGYATDASVAEAINAIDLTPYATTADVSTALATKANTEDIPSLAGYATDASVAEAINAIDLTPYATTADVSTALATKANTEDIPSLEGYATDASVAEAINAIDFTPYATTADVSTALAGKVDNAALDNYVTDASLNETLGDYITDASVAEGYISNTQMENVELSVATAVNRLTERVENIETTLLDEEDGSEDSSTGDSSTGDTSTGLTFNASPYTLATGSTSGEEYLAGSPYFNGTQIEWSSLTNNNVLVYVYWHDEWTDDYNVNASISYNSKLTWSNATAGNQYMFQIPFSYTDNGQTYNTNYWVSMTVPSA